MLGSLQNNGGALETVALLPGSPAIDAGSNALAVDSMANPLTTDERGPGFNRIINNIVDIGAYEFQPPAIVTLTSSLNPSATGQTVTFTATLGLVPGSNTPQGTVTFFSDGAALGSSSLNGLTATFSINSLATGSHQIVATFNGVVPFPSSSSPALTQVVRPGGALIAVGTDVGGGPEVKVFNAVTGALELDFFAFNPLFTGGVRVALGDVNGDGVPDIIAVPGPGMLPEVKVFDGRNGQLLYDFYANFQFNPLFTGGVFVAAGDINHDGFADIVVGADAGGLPEVKAFSGKSGAVLYDFYAFSPFFSGGVAWPWGTSMGTGSPISSPVRGRAALRKCGCSAAKAAPGCWISSPTL